MTAKNILAWIGGVVGVVILLVALGAFLIQQKTFAHRYVLAKMIQLGEKSTGGGLAIGNFSIRWIPLRVTLKNAVVRGRETNAAEPLARFPKVEIGISWSALLRKNVDLTEVILERPSVNVVVNDQGQSNLPVRAASGAAPSGSKLQISVRHAAVNNGELRYNHLPRKIAADLADLHVDVNHSEATNRYSGSLRYSDGQVVFDGYAPLRHEAEIRFATTQNGMRFDTIHVATESSQLNAKATLRGYSNPIVNADYQVLLSTADLRREWQAVPLSRGEVKLNGSLTYDSAAGSGLNAFSTSGQVSSDAITADLSAAQMELRSIVGKYSLARGDLHVTDLRAEALGGVLHAEFSGEQLTATPRYQASLSSEGLSVGQAQRIAGATEIPVSGTARLQARAHWVSSIRNLVANADAAISAMVQGAASSPGGADRNSVPVNATLHLAYDAPQNTLTLTNTKFTSEQTSVTANGTISDHSALSLRAQSSDLGQAEMLITAMRNILSNSGNAGSATPLNLRGRASLQAEIQGRIQDPRVSGRFTADGFEIRQSTWPHIQADFAATSSSVKVTNGTARSANQGRLTFALATQLEHWSYSPAQPVTAQLQASQVPMADLERLTGFTKPVSGMLSGNIALSGTVANPTGEGSLQLQNASIWGEPVRGLTAQVHAADKTIRATFRVTAPAGTVRGDGEFNTGNRGYRITIDPSGLNLAQIHYLSSHDSKIAGMLNIAAQGQGTLQAPQLDVTISANGLELRNAPAGSMEAQIHIANQQVNFALTSTIEGGQINAHGNAAVRAPYLMHGGFDIQALQFGPLLAAYAPSLGNQVQGETEVHGQIDGPLAEPRQIRATIDLAKLNLAYQSLMVNSVRPVRLSYADSMLNISEAELKGTGTDFRFGGTVPTSGAAPMNVTTTGLIDLKLLTILGSNTQASGTLKVDVTARGALKQPQVGGTIELVDATFVNDVSPVGVDNVNARIALANNRLTIEKFSGQMGGGTFSVSGFASYAPVSFSLQVNGKSVRIRYPQGTRAQLDAGLTLTGTQASSLINGRVTIDQLSFTPNFDLANFVGQLSSSAPSTPAKWEQNTRLDVAVASTAVLGLSSSQLSLQGSVDLRVAGTIATPVVLGRTTLTGGSLIFMGNVYQVQSGTVIFANPVRTEPTVNLYVTTVVEQYNLTLNFVGPLDRLRTNYTSDPTLPPVDIIHLLAFGKTSEQAAATATPASLGAQSVLANGLASQVSNRIEKLTGISELQIDPSLGGNNSNPGARVAIQQRVSSNILFTFATDLTDTQNEVVQMKYQTRGRLSISLTRDEYGSYAIEIKTRKTF